MKRAWLLATVILALGAQLSVYSQESAGTVRLPTLQDDPYLHPVDGITPYTLRRNEFIYAQSIQTLPFPSWGFWGITDAITVQLDFLPWTFGFFSPLRKPIPSLNVRYRFNEQRGLIPTVAIETMYVQFWEGLERFSADTISVFQEGHYVHLKPVIGYQIADALYLSASVGVDFTSGTEYRNRKTGAVSRDTDSFSVNYSLGVSYRPLRWASVDVAYTYGPTLTYLENVQKKHQITYGFRIAPFISLDAPFLRAFRVELVSINAYFPTVSAWESFPLPIFPYLYWQWSL